MASLQKNIIALVTGGSNGIGLSTCQLLASQPNIHVCMGSRSLEKGQKAISSMGGSPSPSSISLVQLDITSDESIAAAVEEVENKHGRLDVLINNAGVCPVDFNRSSLQDVMNVNAISPALVTQAFAPLLLASASPRIIYVSSVVGSITQRCDPNDIAYTADYKAYRASKAALNMLVACDSYEYKDRIKVFSFCPGYVVTDLAGERQSKIEAGFAKSPLGSAQSILRIVKGERDVESGMFLHDNEVGETYPW